ncbi:MAG TPA: hypothetical protein VFN71_09560 [Methylomirabilota bacterium]|nr:hypothetical protein [Methylomirabilota bacterium]
MDSSGPQPTELPALNRPFLFVIARGNTRRFEQATHHFGEEAEVEIVYDRRLRERRAERLSAPADEERRHRERRAYDISQDLFLSGWAYIRRAEPA